MTKDEALKLALEAIEACLSAGTEAEDQDASDKLCDARAAIREALSEQPTVKDCLTVEQPAQQQEPVAYIHRQGNHWEVSERFLCDDEKARGWTEEPLYTSPPASKPWVGLTDKEFQWIYDNGRTPAGMMELTEAKLREKNA